MDNKIVYIKLEDIIPHPRNPRKDLGDLEEMAADIKTNGLLQNLMVIPVDDGKYMTLIGHRRSAAARLAGLTEVPCTVADKDMPMNEQVAIMLKENIQRANLTILEEADGFQMMFDLGDTVSEISRITGFSESTIYRRKRLTEYSREKVVESLERGANLSDYDYLGKIKDPKTRKKLIDEIGTANFKWWVDKAVADEEREEFLKPFYDRLDKIAKRTSDFDYKTMRQIDWINCENISVDDITIENYDKNKKYYYIPSDFNKYIRLCVERTSEEKSEKNAKDEEHRKKEQERIERCEKLQSIFRHMEQSCFDFIKDFKTFPGKKATEKLNTIYKINTLLIERTILGMRISADEAGLTCVLGVSDDENYIDTANSILANSTEEKKLLVIAYALVKEYSTSTSIDYYGRYRENSHLLYLYEIMKLAGYELSDEERAILDGTHELYFKG